MQTPGEFVKLKHLVSFSAPSHAIERRGFVMYLNRNVIVESQTSAIIFVAVVIHVSSRDIVTSQEFATRGQKRESGRQRFVML